MELRAPAHMKQNVVLSILKPFLSISAKKWEGAAQKTEFDEGDQGGPEHYYFTLLFEFCTFFTNIEANMYFLQSRNPFFKVLIKYDLSFFGKLLFNVRLSRKGAFVPARITFSIKFWCFVNVEWKIHHSDVHSENLSTLHLFVWT